VWLISLQARFSKMRGKQSNMNNKKEVNLKIEKEFEEAILPEKKKNYIFITEEGLTYQLNSTSPEPDIENCQVIGFAKGKDEDEALKSLIKESYYLLNTNFNEIICIELKHKDYYHKAKYFYLSEHKRNIYPLKHPQVAHRKCLFRA